MPLLPAAIGAIALPDGPSEETPDARQKRDDEILRWTDNAIEEARLERDGDEQFKDVALFMDYLKGKQWDRSRPNRRTGITVNRVWSLFWEMVSMLTDLRQVGEVRPTIPRTQELLDIAQKINRAISSWWMAEDADMALSQVVCYALMSTGYAKEQWNPVLQGGIGDVELVPMGMDQLTAIRPGNKICDAEVLVYQDVRSLRWLRSRFKERAEGVGADPEFSQFQIPLGGQGAAGAFRHGLIGQAMSRLMGSPNRTRSSVAPICRYYEFWVKDDQVNEGKYPVLIGQPGQPWSYIVAPGEALYPRGRVIVRAGRKIMAGGEPNPYLHGEFPFADLRLNRVPWQSTGLAEMRPWVSMQNGLNQITDGVLQQTKKMLNPVVTGPKNSLDEAGKANLDLSRPGEQLWYNPTAGEIKIQQPPQLPAIIMQVQAMLGNEMDRSSGLSATQEMLSKRQIPAGNTMDRVKAAMSTPVRLKGRNIEVFLRHIARQGIWNVCQFYTAERELYIGGPTNMESVIWNPAEIFKGAGGDEGKEQEAKLRETWGKALGDSRTDQLVQMELWRRGRNDLAKRLSFHIEPGSALDLNREERAAYAMRLRLMGDLSLPTLYREIRADIDPVAEQQKLLDERKQKAAAAAALGIGMPAKGQRVSRSHAGQGRVVPAAPR